MLQTYRADPASGLCKQEATPQEHSSSEREDVPKSDDEEPKHLLEPERGKFGLSSQKTDCRKFLARSCGATPVRKQIRTLGDTSCHEELPVSHEHRQIHHPATIQYQLPRDRGVSEVGTSHKRQDGDQLRPVFSFLGTRLVSRRGLANDRQKLLTNVQ